MKLREVTEQEIRNAKCRGYNPAAWDAEIDRRKKYSNTKFYIEIESPYEYEKFWATYQLPEGFILLKEVSYSTCLTNNGFCRIEILEDGTVQKHLFKGADGKEGYAANEPPNRKLLAQLSIKFGHIFTNSI